MKHKIEKTVEETKKRATENLNNELPLPSPSIEEISRVFNTWKQGEKRQNNDQTSKDDNKDQTFLT